VEGIEGGLEPGVDVNMGLHGGDAGDRALVCRARLDSSVDVEYYAHGGVLPKVLRLKLGG
jgi:aconitate hydratase